MSAAKVLNVVLVEPEIHWNTGAVGRSCLAAGAQLHLVEPLGYSLDAKQLRRSGLDYWPRVAPRVWPSWAAIEVALDGGELGTPYYLAPRRGRSLYEARFTGSVALVLGKESTGLPEDVLERHADALVHLPILDPGIRSLNLSTTTGIALYEVRRQWGASPDYSVRHEGAGDQWMEVPPE